MNLEILLLVIPASIRFCSGSMSWESHGTRQWFRNVPLEALSQNRSTVAVYTSGTIYGEISYGENNQINKCRFTEIRSIEERAILEPKLSKTSNKPVERLNFEEMNEIIETCGKISTGKPPFFNLNLNPTFPGTLWCGPGDRAHRYIELGSDVEADRCCRNHDLCPMLALPGTKKTKDGVNKYTISHCDCDRILRECLDKSINGRGKMIALFFGLSISECLASNGTIMNQGQSFDQLLQKAPFGGIRS